MVMETRKIWGAQDVQIAATCIRVPSCARTPSPSTWSWTAS